MAYLAWVTVYGLINFYFAHDVIKRKNYDNTYNYMSQKPAIKKILDKVGPSLAPIAFLTGHFLFWLAAHILAMIQYHWYWLNCAFMCYWLYVSVWNGACFYMDYFARKYEQ